MNCASVKAWMRERFDQGLPIEDGFEPHLESCEGCRVYAEKLLALDAGLSRLTVEPPSPRFEAELAARIRHERQAPSHVWAAALALATACVFVAAGWLLPIVPYLRDGVLELAAWPPDIPVSATVLTPFVDWAWEAWAAIDLSVPFAGAGDPWTSGGAVVALSVMLVGFNLLFRRSGGEPESGPFHRTR